MSGYMSRKLGQEWVLLTADDEVMDCPRVVTSHGVMILVDVFQRMDSGHVFHQPAKMKYFEPNVEHQG